VGEERKKGREESRREKKERERVIRAAICSDTITS
jgi:hypothetical protein